jgi:hypothetical protein
MLSLPYRRSTDYAYWKREFWRHFSQKSVSARSVSDRIYYITQIIERLWLSSANTPGWESIFLHIENVGTRELDQPEFLALLDETINWMEALRWNQVKDTKWQAKFQEISDTLKRIQSENSRRAMIAQKIEKTTQDRTAWALNNPKSRPTTSHLNLISQNQFDQSKYAIMIWLLRLWIERRNGSVSLVAFWELLKNLDFPRVLHTIEGSAGSYLDDSLHIFWSLLRDYLKSEDIDLEFRKWNIWKELCVSHKFPLWLVLKDKDNPS